jgi:putative phosphoribosyl transferase
LGIFLIPFAKRAGYIILGIFFVCFKSSNIEIAGELSHNERKKENMARFRDRREAGRILAQKLSAYANRLDVIVLALPRGGVPVAYEVALALNAPMDIFLVRKLGLPGHEELAIGAIASGGVRVLNEDIIRALHIPKEVINIVAQRELRELQRREQSYRGDRPAPEVRDRTVILIDDGLATGASMRAAVAGLRAQHPAWIVVAVPAAAPETCAAFQAEVDEVVCAITPEPFLGVGRWYEDFSQTTDEEVRMFLEKANHQLLHR